MNNTDLEKINKNPFENLETNLVAIEKLADILATSDIYNAQFLDKDNKVNKSDIIACLILGNELGLSPMASITLGRKLNAKTYFSVIKGKSMGLDPITAISNIYNISTQGGDILYTGVHIISKCIIDAGVKMTILRDFSPIYGYKDVQSGVIHSSEEFEEIKDTCYIVTSASTEKEVLDAKQKGLKFVQRLVVDRITEIRFERPEKNVDIKISYSLKEATDAGLYVGYNSTLKDDKGNPIYVKGKSNWNNHPATHLRNRVISIGGRIVVADKLQGIYSYDEALELKTNIPHIEEKEAINVEIIEDHPQEDEQITN